MSARWVNAWGKVADLLTGEVDLLGKETQVVLVREHLGEGQPGVIEATRLRERIDVEQRP